MNNELRDAYRFHRNASTTWQGRAKRQPVNAIDALQRARDDVATGNRRYFSEYSRTKGNVQSAEWNGTVSANRAVWFESVDGLGLRFIGHVQSDCSGRNGYWTRDEKNNGWYNDAYQDETTQGVVYQLPAHKGQARFISGYVSINDEGVTLDLGAVFTSATDDNCSYDGAQGNPSAIEAARVADAMAKAAAESAREHNTAWQAGSQWADKGAEIADLRREALAQLAARRALRSARLDETPAIASAWAIMCKAARDKVKEALRDIAKLRTERADLAAGNASDLYFYPDERLKSAFCDGADLSKFPA